MSSVPRLWFYSLLFCCRILLIVMTRNSVVIDGGVVNSHLLGKKEEHFNDYTLYLSFILYEILKNSSVFFIILTRRKIWSPHICQHFSKEFSLFSVLDNKATIGQNNVRVQVLPEGSEKYFESNFGFFFFSSFDISLFGCKYATGTYVRSNFNMINITVFHFYQLY